MLTQRMILLGMLGLSIGFCKASQEEHRIIDLTEDDNASENGDGDSRIALVDRDERIAASLQLKEAVIAQNVREVERLLRRYRNFDYSAFCYAIENGCMEIVKIFLGTKEVDGNTQFFFDHEVDENTQYNMTCGWPVTPLLIAIRKKNYLLARLLVDAGADVNLRIKGGKSLLYEAADCDNFDAVQLLVERGIKIRACRRYSPLECAVREGNIEMLQFLLNHCFRVCVPKESHPAVHAAALFGRLGMLKYLLKQNPDLATYANGRGDTPLHLAATGGHLDCVKLLVETYNVSIDKLNGSHYTPLMKAAAYGSVNVVRYLMHRGVRLDQQTKLGKNTALDLARINGRRAVVDLLSHPERVQAPRQDEADTLLENVKLTGVEDQLESENDAQKVPDQMQLVEDNQPAGGNAEAHDNVLANSPSVEAPMHEQNQRSSGPTVCEELMQKIEAGDTVHIVGILQRNKAITQHGDVRGYTPLHHAARHGKYTIFRLLVSTGASLHDKDGAGYTALHYAVLGGNKALMRFLLEKKLNIFAEAKDGKTAFDLAVEHGHQEVVALFFETMDKAQKMAVISRQINEGETLFYRAVKMGNAQLVSFLLAGLDNVDKVLLLNRPTKRGELPLHEAVKKGLHMVGRLLIENGACVSSYDIIGATPLHYAVGGGHVEMVQVLLDAGAVVQLRDRTGITVLDSAKNSGNQRIVDLLQQRGRDLDEPAAKRQKTC